ncbi:phosphopentomutase [candidate division GN15 bacterium]|nr:phosphopentomutase [candidate division GN15 bacterium]
MSINRVIVIVIDACGVGEMPDAAAYGDTGASTIPHVAEAAGGLHMPHSAKLGLGNIVPIKGVPPADTPIGCYGKMAERAPGKDSTTGHWELAGVKLDKPFPVFPEGFPPELIDPFVERVGVEILGNKPASGTEIIKELGEEHLATGKLIVYTSADSVFQIAAHEELYPPDRLYDICKIARELCVGEFAVGRVIARPFIGEPGMFERTTRRKDFSRLPDRDTILDLLVQSGRGVLSIGKIYDLYGGRGFTHSIKTTSNKEVMTVVQLAVRDDRDHSLIMANCVDFDMLWGHRNDEAQFAKALEEFDTQLGDVLEVLREDDLLIITADHGCDPTQKLSTDHTREYVPLLVYSRSIEGGIDLGTRSTFADVAETVAGLFSIDHTFGATALPLTLRKTDS